jgi:hypothetical protein
VKPGFWYHIAGWAYEEPTGEVLDPVKLLNSYGFGLCYAIAPLLEAVWEAAGFEDARVWFLTGHTVTEVFYDGAYHHYDSDMMGYTPAGMGDPKSLPVASVRQIEKNPKLMLGRLLSPTKADPKTIEFPWYPADLRASAMDGLAGLFSSARDNYLFPHTRFPQGHTMDFVLRPGERMTRYFHPEKPGAFYLPYKHDGRNWSEFPREIERYKIRTEDGPHSQRDDRLWATGRLDYTPVLSDAAAYYESLNENLLLPASPKGVLTPRDPEAPARAVFEVVSPYVIIDAEAALKGAGEARIETSTDEGSTWQPGRGMRAQTLASTEHGAWTAVSGKYRYLLRVTIPPSGRVEGLTITTRFQLNPRTLATLENGRNELVYQPGTREVRRAIPVHIGRLGGAAQGLEHVEEAGQGMLVPGQGKPGTVLLEISSPDGQPLTGFDAGGRFLDIREGLAPDKLTAETRKTAVRLAAKAASLEWSLSPAGKFQTLWSYAPDLQWKDGDPVDRLLRWPEVDRKVRDLPPGTKKVYVRYRLDGLALDDIRLAALTQGKSGSGRIRIAHVFRENGRQRIHVETAERAQTQHPYIVEVNGEISNEAIILEVLQ